MTASKPYHLKKGKLKMTRSLAGIIIGLSLTIIIVAGYFALRPVKTPFPSSDQTPSRQVDQNLPQSITLPSPASAGKTITLTGNLVVLDKCLGNLICFEITNIKDYRASKVYVTNLQPENIGEGVVTPADSFLNNYQGLTVRLTGRLIPASDALPEYLLVEKLTRL